MIVCQVCEGPATAEVVIPDVAPSLPEMVGHACREHTAQVLASARYFHPLAFVRRLAPAR